MTAQGKQKAGNRRTRVHRRIRKVTDRSRLNHVANGEAADGLVLRVWLQQVSFRSVAGLLQEKGRQTLGHMREQFEQRIEATWPRPFLLRPPALLFFVTAGEKRACQCRAHRQTGWGVDGRPGRDEVGRAARRGAPHSERVPTSSGGTARERPLQEPCSPAIVGASKRVLATQRWAQVARGCSGAGLLSSPSRRCVGHHPVASELRARVHSCSRLR